MTAGPCSCNGSLACDCPPDVRAFMTGPVPEAAPAVTVPHETEDFSFLAWSWDVAAAWRLMASTPDREVVEVPVDGPAALLGVIKVDHEWAREHADLTRPLLVVRREDVTLLIDGWHRIARADHEGLEVLPAFLLSSEEELACRLR